jgi:hypothetical protein
MRIVVLNHATLDRVVQASGMPRTRLTLADSATRKASLSRGSRPVRG